MSDTKVAKCKVGKKDTSHPTKKSSASPVDSSPLSTPISVEDPQTVDAAHTLDYMSMAKHTNSPSDMHGATPVDAGLSSDDSDSAFDCPYCDKTYTTVKSQKRHIKDEKSVCFRTRGETGVSNDGLRWSCPRCHATMSKKYSVIRHIRYSCWKICDECCESQSPDCDCVDTEENCTPCEKTGKSCTKHTEAVADCVPMLMTGAPASLLKSRKGPRRQRQKRKAVESPDSSPRAKPRPKRGAKGNRTGQVTFSAAIAKAEDDEDEHAHEAYDSDSDDAAHRFSTQLDDQFNASIPAQNLLRRDQMWSRTTGGSQNGISARSSRMLPPPHGRSLQNMAQGERHGQSTHEMLQRQIQAAQNMGLGSPYMHGYGTGAYPAPVMSSTRTSLNLGQLQRGNALQPGLSDASQSQVGRPPIDLNNQGNHLGGASANGSRFSSRQPSVFADHGHFSAPGSRVASPDLSGLAGGLRRQGSRLPSRQASRQSSAENLRASLNSNADAQSLVLKLNMPRNLKGQLSLVPSTQVSDSNNPTIRLRIHSNSYDLNGAVIFSILTMRMRDQFGPRLDYFCSQRGTRYGYDWKVLYKYRAPTPTDPNNEKYFDLHYTMTPALCRDKEFPGAAMRDGDTIHVVNRRASAYGPDDKKDIDIGTQIACQRIHIQNGETQIFQDPDVEREWYSTLDRSLINQRNQVGDQHNQIVHYGQVIQQRGDMIRQLQLQNGQLQQEITFLRQGRLPYTPNQHMNRTIMPLAQTQNIYAQQRTGFPPGSMADHMQAMGYPVGGPVGGHQGLIHGAADQVGAEEQEQDE